MTNRGAMHRLLPQVCNFLFLMTELKYNKYNYSYKSYKQFYIHFRSSHFKRINCFAMFIFNLIPWTNTNGVNYFKLQYAL